MAEATKTVRLLVTFETFEQVPVDWDADQIRFHFEENYCVHNLLRHALGREAPNTCSLCGTAETKVIG